MLLYCHGHRPKDAPLQAELDTIISNSGSDGFFAKQVEQGWIVAMTSYRKNGQVIWQAMDDVVWLYDLIVSTFGAPSCCILEGRRYNNNSPWLIYIHNIAWEDKL